MPGASSLPGTAVTNSKGRNSEKLADATIKLRGMGPSLVLGTLIPSACSLPPPHVRNEKKDDCMS